MIENKSRIEHLEKGLNLTPEELARENMLLEKATAIYRRIENFVNANKDSDDKDYRGAYVKLPEGRKIFFPFDKLNNQVKIWRYHINEGERNYGDSCYILPTCDCGFVCSVDIFLSDKDKIELRVSEKQTSNTQRLTEEQCQLFENYLIRLDEALNAMSYDFEATHNEENLTQYAIARNNAKRCEDEITRLYGNADPKTVVLPSVKAAVDWWIGAIKAPSRDGGVGDDFNASVANPADSISFLTTKVTDMQLEIFGNELSRRLMEQLRRGLPARIDFEYNARSFLHDALEEANISDARLPYRTSMTVNVDSVQLTVAGFQQEIFKEDQTQKGQQPIK